MVKSIKNVFSSFVAMVTVLASVTGGVAFGSVQTVSAAMAGDLIKASGPAVYYYAADGKRYVFPNEKTYFSWYVDFSGVKTISDSELANITIGGNVTVRPGTKLVKITTDPKVYAVTKCGTLHWIESEMVAKSLYGDAWGTRVIDVPDAFFVNYTVGSSLATAVHPDGQLVQYSGDSNWYVVWNGQKRKFASDAAFMANNLNKINSVMTTISYPNGADVTGYEADLGATVCAGASTPVGGNLTVSLASDTPAGMTVPRNSSSVPLAKFMFVAGNSDVTVSGATLHNVGVGAASDFAGLYLYDQNGTRLTTSRTVNSTSYTATFSGLHLTVPAGGSQALYVYGDFNVASGSTGGQHALELMDAASVAVTSGTVQGSFPVRGNVFTVGTSAAGRLDVLKGATPSNPTVGSVDAEVSNFKLTANTNNILVNQVTLYQAGSITNSDLSNFKLYQGNTLVAEAASITGDGRIVLKFSPAYLIQNGTTKVFSLHAKVGGRSDRTIKTYVEYTTDVNAIDQVYNSGASVCISATSGEGGCTANSQGSFNGSSSNYIEVTTQGGNLTRAFNGPATSNVAKGSLGVVLHKFALTSENNAEIRNLRVSIDKTSGSGCYVQGSLGTKYFRNVRIVNMDANLNWMGPMEINPGSNSATGSGTMVFSDTQNIQAGQTVNLAVVADLSNTEDGDGQFYLNGTCGYKATVAAMQSSDVRLVDTGEFLATSKIVPNNNLLGNEMFVKTSSLTVTLAGDPSTGTVVKKQQKVPVVGLVFTPGSQSSVLINSVTLTCQADLAADNVPFGGNGAAVATGLCDERISSLSLWDGNTQVGLARAPDSATGRAQITNMNLLLPAGSGGKTLVVKADLTSTASTTSPYDQIAVGLASTDDVVAQDGDSNTVTASYGTGVVANATGSASPSVKQIILNSGVLTVANDAHPASTIVIAGKDAWVPFAQYKATAQYEDIMLDRLAIFASTTGINVADNADFAMVAVAAGGAVKGSDILSAGATGTKDIDLSASPITVPKNGSIDFQLWAKLSAIQASSSVSGVTTGVHRSGHVPALGLMSGLTTGEWSSNYTSSLNVRATGAASGERVYTSSTNAAHGNGMVSRKSKPVVTRLALSTGTLANGLDQDLFKFQVAADSAGSISVKQVVFSLSKTSGVTLSNFKLRKGGSDMNSADFAVNFASSTGSNITDVENGSVAAALTSGWVIVSFTNEESISGSGNVYSLHATAAVVGSSQNVSLNFLRDSSSSIVTGYLVNGAVGPYFATSTDVYHIDTATAPDGLANATGTFLWSDQSEVPHSSSVSASAASRDWTNDVYVESLSETQTLTAS